jgi:hypothetical protein
VGYDETGSLEAVKVAFELSGGDVNATNDAGDTALHCAVVKGLDDVVQFLVDHGAKLDLRNKRGQTPLWFATWKLVGSEDRRPAYSGRGSLKHTRELLLKLGAKDPGELTGPQMRTI